MFQLAGVQVVIAVSMARIFQRNLLNLGLPGLTCPGLVGVKEGELVTVDLRRGLVSVEEREWPLEVLDPFHRELLDRGGLLPWLGLPC